MNRVLATLLLLLTVSVGFAGSYVPVVDQFNPWAFGTISGSRSEAATASSIAAALKADADAAALAACPAAVAAATLKAKVDIIEGAWSEFEAEMLAYVQYGPVVADHDLWDAVDWGRKIRNLYDSTGVIALASGDLKARLIDGRDRADSLYVELGQHFAERMMRWDYVPDNPTVAQMNAAWAVRAPDLAAPDWYYWTEAEGFTFRQSTHTGN